MCLFVAALFLFGCASKQPFVRFSELRTLTSAPEEFDELQGESGVANAKISLRAPGLRGSASGTIRHAQANQYMVELYGRGELFMKVYYTGVQTVVWPVSGSPQIFTNDSAPTLRTAVNSLLPDWRLDDVLPVPISRESDADVSSWAEIRDDEYQQRIVRDGHDVIYKSYQRRSDDSTFPFRRVTLQSETGESRMTWSIEPGDRSTH